MTIYAVGFNEVDFGGSSILQGHPFFFKKEDCEEYVRNLPETMWGEFFVAELEVR